MALFMLDEGLDYPGKYVDHCQFMFMLKPTKGSARSRYARADEDGV